MSDDASDRPVYPGGIDAVLTQMEGRRDPFTYAEGEGLPPLDLRFAPLRDRIVGDPDADAAEAPPFRSSYHRKRHALRRELTGQSELVFLNALLISHLRKRSWPTHAPALFRRLWAEEGAHLIERLDPRWLVSSVSTFGDHGATAAQRSLGLALFTLMGTMKLYEFERLHSGHGPDTAFPLDRRVDAALPLRMDPYSLTSGGLDVNLIGRLWREAEGDAVLGPPARHLLTLLIHEPASLFRRLQVMRQRKARAAARPRPLPAPRDPPRWGLVATVDAAAADIARFVAHHLELGATALHLYLDTPNAEAEALLRERPEVHVTRCDAAYWSATGRARPEAHQLRQVRNATAVLQGAAPDLDWLAHIDVDEFLLPEGDIAQALRGLPRDATFARMAPVELLAPAPGEVPRHFKRTHRAAGRPPTVVEEIYPTFGLHLDGGFVSHVSGKVFARPGQEGVRFGIHTLRRGGAHLTTEHAVPGVALAHLHAASWEHFRDRFAFRRARGSYRVRENDGDRMSVGQILGFLHDTEGEEGLRAFFDEVCRDGPDLRARLSAHDMLVTRPLDLDGAVRRVFGQVPA
ncbi:glycosyltransferase family 2 protein [Roseivivax marinus]|uniref:glycosyltransferase family 2 protein n=1 Tax=Roseivivax marinus TaxID=1379903 RepID=UPI001F04F210|nr:glycosyltransferase family 2 protein [Roseivivax marinus]UMA65691.1 glycosyltransferase family 2 protein [Roseivivax marinus]